MQQFTKRSDKPEEKPDDQRSRTRPALVEELVEELAEGLRQEVGFLREELARRNEELRRREEEHQEESRRKDSIIMAMTQRIPELEAPRDTPEPSQTVFRDKDGEEAPPDQERRSWWQRLFGAPPSPRI